MADSNLHDESAGRRPDAAGHLPTEARDKHLDPLTGEPGSHPLAAAVGAAAAAAAGAAIGSLGGPLGALAGVVLGGLAGGVAGKELAEELNPTGELVEHAYWNERFRDRPYAQSSDDYEHFRLAYQLGWEAEREQEGRAFDELEPELRAKWEAHEAKPDLEWERARGATFDAWQRNAELRREREQRIAPDQGPRA